MKMKTTRIEETGVLVKDLKVLYTPAIVLLLF